MIDQISFKFSSNVYLTPPSATPTPSRAVVSIDTIAALLNNDTSSNAVYNIIMMQRNNRHNNKVRKTTTQIIATSAEYTQMLAL